MQRFNTRVDKQRREQQMLKFNNELGRTLMLKSESLDQTGNTHKLLILEALHIGRERPKINTRDEFSSRELILKM